MQQKYYISEVYSVLEYSVLEVLLYLKNIGGVVTLRNMILTLTKRSPHFLKSNKALLSHVPKFEGEIKVS